MSHAANANCKCSASTSLCVINTRLLTFILLLEKKCMRGGRGAVRIFSSLIWPASQSSAAENWGSSLQKLPVAIYGAAPAPPSSQRQQRKFQANYLTIATLSAMTATRTIHGSSKLFCAATSAPPTSIDDCAINFVV